MSVYPPDAPPDAGAPATSAQSYGLSVWAIRQAGDDLANMTVGTPPDTLISAVDVARLLRHHGIVMPGPAVPDAAPTQAPWVVVWPAGQQLVVIPAATGEDAEAMRTSIREAGGEAIAARLATPAAADAIADAARAAAAAGQASAARRREMRAALEQLVPPPPPAAPAPVPAAAADDDMRALRCD